MLTPAPPPARAPRRLCTMTLATATWLAGCAASPRAAEGTPRPDRGPEAAAAPAFAAPRAAEGSGEARAAITWAALVGRRAPAAQLALLDGRQVALAELVGRTPVYLKFWATWCVPCRAQMPHLEATFRKHGDRLAVFAVDLGLNDAPEAVRAVRASEALTVPIALDADGALGERFGVAVTPLHILIDRAGVVRYVGHEVTPELDAAIERLAATAPAPDAAPAIAAAPAPAPTRPAPLSLALRGGATFALDARRATPVALTFVTTWCDSYLATSRPAMAAACAAHARALAKLRPQRRDITWIVVAHPVWTSAADLDAYAEKFGPDVAIGLDQRAAWFERFGVRDVATTVLLDRAGAEVARVGGAGDALEAALARLR